MFFSNICGRKGKGLGERPALITMLRMLSLVGVLRTRDSVGVTRDAEVTGTHPRTTRFQVIFISPKRESQRPRDPGQGF